MRTSILLEKMFETERWQALLDKSTEKGIDEVVIKQLCYPQARKELFDMIANDQYNVFPPHVARIPKDNGKYITTVYPDMKIGLTLDERKKRIEDAAKKLPTAEESGYHDLAGKLGVYEDTREWAVRKTGTTKTLDGVKEWEKYFGITEITKTVKGRTERVPEYREVYVNEARDRIVLALINDCLCELFADMVHPQCRSYQKGTGTQKMVKEISGKVDKLSKQQKVIGVKSDFSKYFDNVRIEVIDDVFDKVESKLGFSKGTEPVINLLRRYYHQDLYFDIDGTLKHHYQGLKQGCAVASWLANVVLYELDDYMTSHYDVYYRYSDDSIVLDKDTRDVVDVMNSIISKYGITLNPDKVDTLYADKWFKFLGFNLKNDQITLSGRRVKKFQKEIEARSIDRKKKNQKYTAKAAKNSIIHYLYEGEHCWATSCLGTVNVESDLDELNKFIMDCIRACDTGKLKVGGLGTTNNLPNKTILRGKGRNVSANKAKTGHIENYLSLKCMSNNLKICKPVFMASVKTMR
mgnify:CR=1 FL=1